MMELWPTKWKLSNWDYWILWWNERMCCSFCRWDALHLCIFWLLYQILSLGSLMYLNSLVFEKEFNVAKMISSRGDLHTEEYNNWFKNQDPMIFIGGKEVNMNDYTPIGEITNCLPSNVNELLLEKQTLIPPS